MVTGFEQFTQVIIIEDHACYYVESVETGDQVDIAFNDPKVARRYALSQRLVLVDVDYANLAVTGICADKRRVQGYF